MNDIPIGLCQCGCGQTTNLATMNNTRNNTVKGEPQRYIKGHDKHRPEMERFWEKVEVRGADDCWNWLGALDADGYGRFRTDNRIHSRWAKVSRFIYEYTYGELPKHLNANHTCRNRRCVNLNHIHAGTQKENVDDAIRDGTYHFAEVGKGEASSNHKATQAQVDDIRERFAGGESRRVLEKDYNLSHSQIGGIIRGDFWED